MAGYVKIAEEVLRRIRERREITTTATMSKFRCWKCGTQFDTSVGIAKHSVDGCDWERLGSPSLRSLPQCSTCGSYALYREKDGTLSCETCRLREAN